MQTAKKIIRIKFLYSCLYKPLYKIIKKRNKGSLVAFVISVTVLIAAFYGSYFLADLVYLSEELGFISLHLLALCIFLPFALLFFILIILIQITLNYLSKKRGTSTRFKIVFFFFIMITIPSVLSAILINEILKRSMNFFLQEELIENLETKVARLQERMEVYKKKSKAELIAMIINRQTALTDNHFIDSVIKYTKNNTILSIVRKNNQIPTKKLAFPPSTLINSSEDIYFTFQDGYFFTLLPITNKNSQQIYGYVLSSAALNQMITGEVNNTVELLKQAKRLQLFKEPLKNTLLFLYLYYTICINALGIILFYYRSSQIFYPITLLASAIKNITKGEYRSIHIKNPGTDEVKELVEAFQQMVQELRATKNHIKRIGLIEAWKDVAIRLAHEIKNPLTPIKLNYDHIQSVITKKDFNLYYQLSENFNLINNELNTVEKLVKDFSQFSKDLEIHRQKVAMKEIIEQIKTALQHYETIQYQINRQENIDWIYIDKEKILQIFTNLIQNSINSVQKKNGFISIATEVNTKIDKKQYLHFHITDNGPGIAEEHQSYIFTPYFTTRKDGTGLGLYICEKIIKAHQGSIWFVSDKNETTFTISIPVPVKSNTKAKRKRVNSTI